MKPPDGVALRTRGGQAGAELPLQLPALLAYGGFGLPLAFVALPIYVMLPNTYSQQFGMSLALIGGLLLGARLLDAVVDPLIGLWVDHLRRRGSFRPAIGLAVPLMAAGFAALFHPPVLHPAALAGWMLLM